MTDQYAVVGDPIKHSLSPQIHRLFAQQTGQDLHYTAKQVPLSEATIALRQFFTQGGCGLNVTVPLKETAWQLVDVRVELAERAGAVNTIMRQPDGQLHGYNTDGLGLVRDLTLNQGLDLNNLSILVLGAGGAVRGVLQPLLNLKPARLHIANRTVSKAQALESAFADIAQQHTVDFSVMHYTNLQPAYDLVINGTSLSLQGHRPDLPSGLLSSQGVVYDMVYSQSPTAFVQWGIEQGARALDGRGMLIEQAAAAFKIWRGVTPDTKAAFSLFDHSSDS